MFVQFLFNGSQLIKVILLFSILYSTQTTELQEVKNSF